MYVVISVIVCGVEHVGKPVPRSPVARQVVCSVQEMESPLAGKQE
jgi:hypothetical protein